ncbi:Histidine-containing phosphotransfer protein 4 [Morus notabilis]|uniref:Histidine-containing phosphotransfer protein n=1 Tax=Morus notabilis TaxID=981085 RepID=W9R6U6_9ROSA|nr:Histidine-containing phosphotransfer protein 4 [Morus notabilis]
MEPNSTDPLREQLAIMRNSLLDEKMLDIHFRLLETLELENKEKPNFVEDTMNMYFESSAEKIAIFEDALENPPSDFSDLKRHIYQFKGSSGSVGAIKVMNEVVRLIECIDKGDIEGAKIVVQHIKKERDTLEGRLEPYFQVSFRSNYQKSIFDSLY